jgi:putative transposase
VSFWRLYYHFVWSTKERSALIKPVIEADLYGYMIGKGVALGAIIHAIGGVEDHVHLVASVPPSLALSDFVKGVKGSSSHHINHGVARLPYTFAWQGGYGVFSLAGKQLGRTVDYVVNQKEHHRYGTLIDVLEREDQDDDCPQSWRSGAAWRHLPVMNLRDSNLG